MPEIPRPPYPPTPLEGIEAGWEALQQCDLRTASIDSLKVRLKALAKGRIGGNTLIPTGTRLYRARNYDPTALPSHVSLLGARPPLSVKDLQRCNREGKSIFYCCQERLTTFRELRKLPGDRMILSEWELLRDLTVLPLGFHPEVFKRLGSGRDCPNLRKVIGFPFPEYEPETNLLEHIFAECLTLDVDENEEYRYKLSIAITEMLIEPSISSQMPGRVNPGADGILYPSVQLSGNRNNLAIKFDIAKSHLKFIEAQEVELVSDDERTSNIKQPRLSGPTIVTCTAAMHWELSDGCFVANVRFFMIQQPSHSESAISYKVPD